MSFMKSVNFTRVRADGGEGRGHKRAGVQEKTGGEGERERKKERGRKKKQFFKTLPQSIKNMTVLHPQLFPRH